MNGLSRFRSTRRRDTRGPVSTLVRGALAFAVVIGVIAFGVEAYNGVPGERYTYVHATVPQIGNLLQHDPVRIAGVDVGQITGRDIASGGEGLLTLQLRPGVNLPIGTQVLIRANGLLGGRYVELIPGPGSRRLPSGATLRGGPNSVTFGVPEVLDTFNEQTRGALGQAINGVGSGLLGRGSQLNTAIGITSAATVPFERLANGILARPGAAQRLMPSLDRAMTPLAANRVKLAQLPGALANALQPVLDEQSAVVQALDRAPAALRAASRGLTNGDRLVEAITSLAEQANLTLPPLPAGLTDTASLLQQAHTPLRQVKTLLTAVRPAVPGVLKITGSLQPLLSPVRQAADNLTPILIKLGRYGCNIENFGAVARSMTGFGGVGNGPAGGLGSFRLQIGIADPAHLLGLTSLSGLGVRDKYSPPCSYLASKYPGL
jgi:phospholipid/cholesterol/gamma-HCH transport system substrate-binding protein